MNREGNEGGPPDEAEGEAAEVPETDNVIAFPGARVRPVPAPAPAVSDAATTLGGEERPIEEPGMTLDAFERAVRSAVREKLGDNNESRPQGADELVAQVFSALTGKDAKTALSEVRQRLAEPFQQDDGRGDGDVIDLGAVREARQRASLESASKVGGAIKDTFTQFLATLAQRQGMSGEITLDASFFKQHGSSLLGSLFQGLASALMQPTRPATPTPAPEAAPEAPNATADGSAPSAGPPPSEPPKAVEPRAVQVKLDLGSILAGLFRRRDTAPPEPPKNE